MAKCIQNVCRARKVKDFVKALLHQRFFTARAASFTNGPLAIRARPSSIQWNSVTGPTNETPLYTSTAEFHHLAEHTLISNTVYITNNGIRHFAKATEEVPSLEQYMKTVNKEHDNNSDRFEKEKLRLKRKGVMKDITVKIPEGVINTKL